MISKKYFKYLLKSMLPLAIVCGVIGIIALGCFPTLSVGDPYYKRFSYTENAIGPFVIMIVVAFAIPMNLHSRYFSKNSSDIYLSLPVSRKEAFITENLFGLGILVASTVIGFLVGVTFALFNSLRYELLESVWQIFQGLPIILITVIVAYLMSNLAVNLSNSMNEAIIVLSAINAISILIYAVVEIFFHRFLQIRIQSAFFSYAPGTAMTMFLTYKDVMYTGDEVAASYEYSWYIQGLASLLINLVIWCGFTYLAYRCFNKLKSEHLGTAIMEKLGGPDAHATAFGFAYLFIGALFSSSVHVISSFYETIIALLGATIAYWVSLFALRRKIMFRKDDLIRFAISAGGSLVLGAILYMALVSNEFGIFPEPEPFMEAVAASSMSII